LRRKRQINFTGGSNRNVKRCIQKYITNSKELKQELRKKLDLSQKLSD
jgi:hypothetical protein